MISLVFAATLRFLAAHGCTNDAGVTSLAYNADACDPFVDVVAQTAPVAATCTTARVEIINGVRYATGCAWVAPKASVRK